MKQRKKLKKILKAKGKNLKTIEEMEARLFQIKLEKLTQKEMAKEAEKRPKNYEELPAREQWEIDKSLGILDWNGEDG